MGAILFSSFKSECIALAPKSLDSEFAIFVEHFDVSFKRGLKAGKLCLFLINLPSFKNFSGFSRKFNGFINNLIRSFN